MNVHILIFYFSLIRLSEKRIIILSIHQPRYSIFSLFNSLTLLSRGQMVYHGPAQQVLPYFETLGQFFNLCTAVMMNDSICAGFPCGEHENPADFIIDVLTSCEKNDSEAVAFVKDTG